ncbi:ASCH domain-containing protein [Dysgonomonas sp. 520]|uniref:ASCH domain-containing protein n=1 Tax=Dysgonomonas sp. 520 TaxID=2302931 RepID=UPI0013D5B39B|nr:ASCH domain-containing protein [Dysgonomonas sp. 520]NDW10936.1 ASCH domain-containing protein [Dysgonomonas sp. 520]
MNKPILHLNLCSKWYDMIELGLKLEEYREDKSYWNRVFIEGSIKIKGKLYKPKDIIVCFSNGYSKNRRQMYMEIQDLIYSKGKQKWGAKIDKNYHILVLGQKINY